MAPPGNRSLVLGFIHIRRGSADAYRGGYLLTTDYGRPIEFHYSSEVVVPKAQQLLFGRLLEPQLYAEILAKPMTDRQSTAPKLIVVDCAPLLELRRLIPAPVIMLSAEDSEADEPAIGPPKPHPDFPKDVAVFEKIRAMVPPGFDWLEPFERIDGALAEIRDSSLALHAA